MATNVILPALGMAQDTGKILQWLKAEGDMVRQGEAIAEIETDKVTVELEAPADGTLSQIGAPAGADVPVGQVIAVILAAGEVAASAASVAATRAVPAAVVAGNGHAMVAAPSAPSVPGRGRLASPKAKRIAQERGIDLATVRGSGPDGVVVAADVLAAGVGDARAPAVAAPLASAAPESGLSAAWRIMAERTTQSWTTAPHFFLLREIEASAFKQWHASAQKRATEKLTYTDLLVKVVATALRQHPRLNATWRDGAIVARDAVNVGLAVAVPDGLLVPVIAQADDLSLNGIARQRRDLVARAQTGKLRPEDLRDGTFTISNLGMFGVDAFTAILNGNQAGILAVGALKDRVIARDGQAVVAPMFTLSLSCDHRVVDGARGAEFLATIADLIADPAGL